MSSDDDETCLNTGQRLYPKVRRKISMRKNTRIEDDDDDSEAETRKMDEQDLDWTRRDPYTHSYLLTRKGKVTLTEKSLVVRAVYRHRRFITVLAKNFYECARNIPYTSMMKCDGVGGVVGRVFLFQQKRMKRGKLDEMSFPSIDLNELKRWSQKGIISGRREDRLLEVVPFEIRQGGRIKKFSEDKIVEIEKEEDEMAFCRRKAALHFQCREEDYTEEFLYTPTQPATLEEADANGHFISTGDLVRDMIDKIKNNRGQRLAAQVNLRVAQMQLENEERIRAGGVYKDNLYVIDNTTKLKLFFDLDEFERMRKPRVQYDEEGNPVQLLQEKALSVMPSVPLFPVQVEREREFTQAVMPSVVPSVPQVVESDDNIYFSDRMDESMEAELAEEVERIAMDLGIAEDVEVTGDHTYGSPPEDDPRSRRVDDVDPARIWKCTAYKWW